MSTVMRRLFLTLLFLLIALCLFPQDFFRGDFNKEKNYIVLMNPTVGNLEVIDFLIGEGLFKVDISQTSFVGVYHPGQKYDFAKTAEFIKQNHKGSYFLHEVRGDLTEAAIFCENGCSDDFRKIFSNSIGIFFFGGPDIPPQVYGEENLYSETDDPVRHYFELSFLFHLIGSSKNQDFMPLLNDNPEYLVTGFCLGMQTINVAAGGSMYQDIPVQLYNNNVNEVSLDTGRLNFHRNYWQNFSKDPGLMGNNLHPVKFTGHPFFRTTVRLPGNLEPLVYSSHHQAVKQVGKGIEVTALSPDGKVVEGIAHSHYPNVFAVQFHPEVPSLYKNHQKLKFSPSDRPETLHSLMDRKSLMFHRKYWQHISSILNSNSKQIK